MPTFDIVSEVDQHELKNAVDQANRELDTRFDFKGLDAKFDLKESTVTLTAPGDFQVKQMNEILQNKLVKRGIDVQAMDSGEISKNLAQAKQEVKIRQGIDKENAKKVVQVIKDAKMKVQAAIQGEQVRVTGKNRDDLQDTIALLREQKLGFPVQFTNFRD